MDKVKAVLIGVICLSIASIMHSLTTNKYGMRISITKSKEDIE
jgi:hypothetical protein